MDGWGGVYVLNVVVVSTKDLTIRPSRMEFVFLSNRQEVTSI